MLDRFGLVWIWMGDPALASEDKLFPVEHYGEAGWTVSRGAPIDIACNYLLITDNLLDPTRGNEAVWVDAVAGTSVRQGLPARLMHA